jgi:uncharacterized membrane protein
MDKQAVQVILQGAQPAQLGIIMLLTFSLTAQITIMSMGFTMVLVHYYFIQIYISVLIIILVSSTLQI